MMITVKELIELLRKMPQNTCVGIADHGRNDDDIDGAVYSVVKRDPQLSTDPHYLPEVTVVIRS